MNSVMDVFGNFGLIFWNCFLAKHLLIREKFAILEYKKFTKILKVVKIFQCVILSILFSKPAQFAIIKLIPATYITNFSNVLKGNV